MGKMADFFSSRILPFLVFSWTTSESASPLSSSNLPHDGTPIQEGEAALLQEDEADLEAGLHGTTQQKPEKDPDEPTAVQTRDAALPVQDVPVFGLTMENQASVIEVTEGQPPVKGRGRLTFKESGKCTDRRQSRTTLKEHLSLALVEVITAVGVLIDLFFIRSATEPISKNPSLIVASSSAFVCLLSGFGLMFDTMRQMMYPGRLLVRDISCCWSKLLHCFSTLSLAFTVVAVIVSFLPKSYCYLPVALVPTLPVIAVSFYNVRPGDDVIVLGSGDDPHKADRKRLYQLIINMITFSFMGALGTIIGYHKNSSNRGDHVYVHVAIYFMLGAHLTGLVTLLLLRMVGSSKDWKKTAVANAIMLCLLVPAVLMVATTFLGGVTAATPFPVALAAAIWYFMECVAPDDYEGELKPLYGMALTAMSLSFGTVMGIFAGFLGGVENGKNLEVCIFLVVSCFMSSVTLGVLTFRPPKKASVAEAAKALGFLTLVLLIVAALALVSYVGH